jgi:sulfatase modifying factor 1
MKRQLFLVLGLALLTLTAGCGGSDKKSVTSSTAGQRSNAYIIGDVSFYMRYVPAVSAFPTGENDDGVGSVAAAYWIGETEVTYGLWKSVYDWATAHDYYFAHLGQEGNGGTPGADPTSAAQEPVTNVNWRDAIVWCNALTEYYNNLHGENLTCVYTYNGAVLRDSQDTNASACDDATAGAAAKGFRLPTDPEWELAARYRGNDPINNDPANMVAQYSNPYFTKGNFASGATADSEDATATAAVAWYKDNSGGKTHVVATAAANWLGLYDMSGNVSEWGYGEQDGIPSNKVENGGNFMLGKERLQVGDECYCSSVNAIYDLGFRLVKTH